MKRAPDRCSASVLVVDDSAEHARAFAARCDADLEEPQGNRLLPERIAALLERNLAWRPTG